VTGRILIVDDIPTNRMILRAKLTAAYYEVSQADSGQSALASAKENPPDLILLDVMMPDLDGFDVCRQLKAEPRTAHIPVIMVTALVNPADRLRGLKCGADDFLSKPINDLALFSRLKNLMRAKVMQDELQLRGETTQDLGLGPPGHHSADFPPDIGRVLLVPQNAGMARQLENTISGLPEFSSQTVPDVAAVLSLDAAQMPDVFVVSARLVNYGDGLRLLSQLRAQQHSRHTGIILVVPKGDQETAAKGLDLGANDYIFEPVDPSELIARLKNQTRRKQISDRLRDNVTDTLRLAVQDPLTGLYNRRYATQHLNKITTMSRKSGKDFALMVLDIDNFKSVNDCHGHAAGDLVLQEFSRRIQENLRSIDLVSRIGGEEFLVAMPDTTTEQAKRTSERLRRIIDKTSFCCPGQPKGLSITVSIGVVMGSPQAGDIADLIEQADAALYTSKNEGRNTVTLASSFAA